MATSIAGFVLRARDRQETARFYTALGLSGNEHRHGSPVHTVLDPISGECVVEIYSRTAVFPQDTLMLNVDSIGESLQIAATFGIRPSTDVREMQGGQFVYITDPDGRPVMFIEMKQVKLGVRS